MKLKELMAKASPLPWSEDPEGIVQVEIESAEGLPVGCAYLSENQAEANSPNATLIVHCVNNFAQVTDALREALTQLDYYNAETRETSRWAEWHSALAAAHEVVKAKPVKWNHMLDVAFGVANSPHENWEDVPYDDIIAALESRVKNLKLNREQGVEPFGFCDTYREPQPHGPLCASRACGECTCGEFEMQLAAAQTIPSGEKE